MLVYDFCENRNGILPDIFYESIPKYCPEENCNFPMEMSEALTQLHCSNPRCPSKVAQRLIAIANSLGVKDMGEARARSFINYHGITNPIDIFSYSPEKHGAMADNISIELSSKIKEQFDTKKSFTLSEYVRMANLPFIQTSAVAIFDGYDDIVEAYKDIEQGGVEFIREKLSIKKGSDLEDSISIRALKIYESLMTYKTDLIEDIGFVNIIKTNTSEMISLKAVCSDEVGAPFKTKADFYATVNNMFSNIHVEFLNAVTKKIDYLVWAGADGSPARYTNKVKKTEGYNAKYETAKANGKLKEGDHYIPILTANQFIETLKGM